MDIFEYNKVKSFDYFKYCDYLNIKYKDKSKSGLFKHHYYEYRKANLSNNEVAKQATEEERNTIIYCNFLEHLLLHILIGEQTDSRLALGLGGAVNYIIPQINKYLDFGATDYSLKYYENIDKDVFQLLCERCNKCINETKIALEHNNQLYLEVEQTLKDKGKALVVLGTGLGKTTTALQYLWNNKCKALVIGPNKLIKSGWEEYLDWVDTTTYQSFASRYLNIDYSKYGLVILDEAHHAGFDEKVGKGAEVWSKGIKYLIDNNVVKVLGLTATPNRSDNVDIGNTLFEDCVCEGYAVEDGIEKGLIYPFDYITSLYNTEELVEEYRDCDNRELVGQLDLALQQSLTLKDIFYKYMPTDVKRKGIIFIQDIKDEQYVKDIMLECYPNIEYRAIHSKMNKEEVNRNREWFENIDEGYLLAVNMISEGAHYKGVNTLIMFRKTSSYLVYTQQLGRIITLTKNENPNAIVFDLVNNIDSIEYSNRDNENKRYQVSKIIRALEKSPLQKSRQVIVADESRDIVKAIREIKQFENDSWEDWEIEIIKTYYERCGAKYCTDKMNIKWKIEKRTKRAVFKKAYNLKLSYKDPIYNNYFSESELNFLLDNYHKGLDFCASKLQNRSKRSISRTLKRFNLSFPSDIIFTDEIKEMLKNLDKSNEDISKETGITVDRIRQKRIMMGIINPKFRHKKWTKDEDNIIISFYPIEGGKCYSRLINRTEEDVRRRAKDLKVKSNARYNTVRKSILCIETGEVFNSIKDASNKIGRRPNAALKNPNKTAGGYHWKYIEERDENKDE